MEGKSRGAELDLLRSQLSSGQREILNTIWEQYREQSRWMPRQALQERFGEVALRSSLEGLWGPAVRESREDEEEACRLTFLGVLLTDQGPESEDLLVRYLAYLRERVAADPRLEWVGSQEVESALNLSRDRSRLLRQLIRLSHWWGGGSRYGNQEWTVGVPVDAEDLPAESGLRQYVREHVLRHFLPELSLGAMPRSDRPQSPRLEPARGVFWFVRDAALRQQLSLDWHEAQDVVQVRAWKSCLILCGGILEGLLNYALHPVASSQTPALRGGPPGDHRALGQLVEAALALRFLEGGSPSLPGTLLAFRSLTDPAWQAREKVEITQADAEAALDAVRRCLRQLAALS